MNYTNYDRGFNVNPNRSGVKNYDEGMNVNPNRSDIAPISKKITRLHPLDISGARRTIGQKVYDPIARTWKVDDGRPRGGTIVNGKMIWGCWGKCMIKKGWWIFKKVVVSCPCNKKSGGGGCECSGCMSNSGC